MHPLHELDDEELIEITTAAFNQLVEPTRLALAVMDRTLAAGMTAEGVSHPVTPENWPNVFPQVVHVLSDVSVRLTVFLKACPGLETLREEDRSSLGQRALYGVLLIAKAPLYVDGESHILLRDGTFFTRDWLRVSLKEEWIEAEHQHARRQTDANLTVSELSLMCLLYVLSYGSQHVVCTDELQFIKERYADTLASHVSRNRVDARQTLQDVKFVLDKLAEMTSRYEGEIFTAFFFAGDNPISPELRFPQSNSRVCSARRT